MFAMYRSSALLGVLALIVALPLSAAALSSPTPTKICVNGTCSTPATTAASGSVPNGIKWHPGQYVMLDYHSTQAAQFAAIDALSSETTVQGIELLVNWAALEGSTPGDYSQGFALIDAYLAKLASLQVPKRLILGLNERKYGTPPPAGTDCSVAAKGLLPDYLYSYSGGGCAIAAPNAAGSLSVLARFWDADVMDRLIALSKAYAQRYDGNPLVEMFFGNGETAVAAPASSGFSAGAYYVQLKRWYDASEPAWPHTQLRLAANYGGSTAQLVDIMTYASANGGVIIGGPDPELPLPNITRAITANQIFRGEVGGGTDFRPTFPWVGEVQSMGLGLKYTQTPADIFNYESNTMHASYMIWMRNTWLGGPAQQWSTGILPFIRSVQGKIAGGSCPTIYQQGCNTN
jgi:hypothetical protein